MVHWRQEKKTKRKLRRQCMTHTRHTKKTKRKLEVQNMIPWKHAKAKGKLKYRKQILKNKH